MKVNAIVQARCGSTRLPNKVFLDIDGHPLLWHVVNRLKNASLVDDIIIATTVNSIDDSIENWCHENNIKCFRGKENNVLNRYYEASKNNYSDVVVRITADDPFKEPSVIDEVVKKLINEKLDLVTNNLPPSFPEGLDCEAFTFETLDKMEHSITTDFEKEHVTQYAYHNKDVFKIGNVENVKDLSDLRWTIDTKEDYEMVKAIYANRINQNNTILLMDEILEIIKNNPKIKEINSDVKRSAMYS